MTVESDTDLKRSFLGGALGRKPREAGGDVAGLARTGHPLNCNGLQRSHFRQSVATDRAKIPLLQIWTRRIILPGLAVGIEDDANDQRQQQHATCDNKAHCGLLFKTAFQCR
jgi:hypothetical protein